MATWFESLLENNLDRNWNWKKVAVNYNLSYAFIQKHLTDPGFKWDLKRLSYNKSIVLKVAWIAAQVLTDGRYDTIEKFESEVRARLVDLKWWFEIHEKTISSIPWPWKVITHFTKDKFRLPKFYLDRIACINSFQDLNYRMPTKWSEVLSFFDSDRPRDMHYWFFRVDLSKNPFLATRKRVENVNIPWYSFDLLHNPGLIKELFSKRVEQKQFDGFWLRFKVERDFPWTIDNYFNEISAVGDGRLFCWYQGLEKIKTLWAKNEIKKRVLKQRNRPLLSVKTSF